MYRIHREQMEVEWQKIKVFQAYKNTPTPTFLKDESTPTFLKDESTPTFLKDEPVEPTSTLIKDVMEALFLCFIGSFLVVAILACFGYIGALFAALVK